MFSLKGKKALITGSSSGIGEAIARCFHESGAIVALHGTREDRLKQLQQELGENSCYFVADLSQKEAAAALAAEVEPKLGGIDILVNNAGITRDGLFLRMKEADWHQVIDVNLHAIFTLTQALLAGMMKRRAGRIINISSVVGVTGNAGQTNYCTSKAGVIGFTKALAQEVASRHITVNAIAPGFISSAMTDKLNDQQKEGILAGIPMKTMGRPEDIAHAALYLASEEARYVTGQTIHVNGGLAMI